MPELPEVETVARQLAPALIGRRIDRVHILDPKLAADFSPLLNTRIQTVERVGKQIVIQCRKNKSTSQWLGIHLRMTGRLLTASQRSQPEPRHLRAFLDLDRGRLLFRDPRRFGTFVLSGKSTDFSAPGLDPVSDTFRLRNLRTLIQGSRSPIKTWLLRQDRICGIGNIYASEILHACGLHPLREAGSLDEQDLKVLHRQIRRILKAAIRHCGTTFSDFQDSRGVEGGYQKYLKVYNRKERPCDACGSQIERLVQQQRSTWFCPCCQTMPINAQD